MHLHLPGQRPHKYLSLGLKPKRLLSGLSKCGKYYDIKNPSYKGIKGRWEGANPNYVDEMSDNFKAYRDAIAANKTPEQAAFETWTGKQAQKQGFTKAKVFTYTDNNNLILVEFTK